MTCIYKRTVEPWECLTSTSEVVYRESLPADTCQSPLDYITSLMATKSLTTILAEGVVIQQPTNYCCPSCGDYYYFGGVDKFLALISGLMQGNPSAECTLTVAAGVETYLILAEAMGGTTGYTSNPATLSCIQSGLTTHAEVSDDWMNLGIIEYGEFENLNLGCAIMETFSESDITSILTNGLVIQCTDDIMIISDVLEYLKYAEAITPPVS